MPDRLGAAHLLDVLLFDRVSWRVVPPATLEALDRLHDRLVVVGKSQISHRRQRIHDRDQIVGTERANKCGQRIADQPRSPLAYVVVSQQDGKDTYVVATGLALFSVAAQRRTRPRAVRWRAAVDADMSKEIDRLRPAVFDDLEILPGQVGDRIAFVVVDDDVNANDVDTGAECRLRGGLWRRRILGAHQRGSGQHQDDDDGGSGGPAHGRRLHCHDSPGGAKSTGTRRAGDNGPGKPLTQFVRRFPCCLLIWAPASVTTCRGYSDG